MLITTTKGLMPVELLEHRAGLDEDHRAAIRWEEYWYAGELVHRSAVVQLKEPLTVGAVAQTLG